MTSEAKHQHLFHLVSLLALQLASTASLACSVPFFKVAAGDPQWAIERSAAVFAGRATSSHNDQPEHFIARLEIDTVFKGQAPRVLVFRARIDSCAGSGPPGSEPFFAFVRFDSGNIQAPDWIGFVPQSAVPADFASKLGKPSPPSADSPLLKRLAPSIVPAASIRRSEGEVSSESWVVNFDRKLWRWDRQPRFYLRYARATFLLDPDYVLTKVAHWSHPELLDAIRRSLPLAESTDLYKFQLNMDVPGSSTNLDRLAVEATMEGRAQILLDDDCCVRTVQVNRSSLGTQTVMRYETELVRSDWTPTVMASSPR